MTRTLKLQNIEPILKPVIPSTLLQIEEGMSAKFRARDFSPLGSVRAAITKLNKAGEKFEVSEVFNNGEAYIVTRN